MKKPKKKDGGELDKSKPLEIIRDLFEASFRIGCCDFWTLTPYEFSLKLDAFNKDNLITQQVKSWHTWHTAALSRCAKMPKLSEFMQPFGGETKAAMNERKLEAMLMARVKQGNG